MNLELRASLKDLCSSPLVQRHILIKDPIQETKNVYLSAWGYIRPTHESDVPEKAIRAQKVGLVNNQLRGIAEWHLDLTSSRLMHYTTLSHLEDAIEVAVESNTVIHTNCHFETNSIFNPAATDTAITNVYTPTTTPRQTISST